MNPVADNPDVRATRKEWTGLAVLALPTLLLSLDLSVLYLALPHLSRDLNADSTQQLWITDIYGFLIAGFLVTMGTLGDRIGRRKLLLIGGVAFGIASVIAAYSSSAEMLIAMRALMGIAGATLMPSTLALISNMFRNPQQRGVAIAAWMTCFMGGMTLGPIVGGVLLEHYWWGSAFLLGVPVMLLLVVAGPLLLPEFKDSSAGRVDLASVGMSLATILPVIYGLKEMAKHGFEVSPMLAIAAGLCFGYLFISRQKRIKSPMIDLELFRSHAFSGSLTIMLVTGLVMGGTFFLISQALQLVNGLSTLEAGLVLLPQSIVMAIASMTAPLIARKVRPVTLLTTGLVISAGGFVMLSQVSAGDTGSLVLTFGVIALGMGATGPIISDLIIGSAPPERAGSAASLQETSGEFGIALGVATIGSLATAVYRNGLESRTEGMDPTLVATARESMASAYTAGGEVLAPAQQAFMSGIGVAAIAGTAIFLALAAITVKVLRNVPTNQAHKPGPGQEAGSASAPLRAGG